MAGTASLAISSTGLENGLALDEREVAGPCTGFRLGTEGVDCEVALAGAGWTACGRRESPQNLPF